MGFCTLSRKLSRQTIVILKSFATIWFLDKQIFISQKFILQTKYEKHLFVAYGDLGDSFTFIVLPGLRPENVPNYKIIQSNTNEIFISLEKIQGDCLEGIREEIHNQITVEDYLSDFIKPNKTKYEKKKPKRFLIENDSNDSKASNDSNKLEEKQKPKKKIFIIEESPNSNSSNKKTKKNVENVEKK